MLQSAPKHENLLAQSRRPRFFPTQHQDLPQVPLSIEAGKAPLTG